MPNPNQAAQELSDLDAVFADPTKRTYGKVETHRKNIAPAAAYVDCKAETPTAKLGTIEGYASVWDVVDHQNELVRKGAFTKTIAERGAKIPLMIKHFAYGGDIECAVGAVAEMVEDDYGLHFKAEWLDDEVSQIVRKKVVSLRAKGVQIGTSIGYRVMSYGFVKDEPGGRTIRELRELALGELTVTLRPALDAALVTGAKTDEDPNGLLAPFAALQRAEFLTANADVKKTTIEAVFGDAAKAKSLCESLKGIAERTLEALSVQPQAAKTSDGATASGAEANRPVPPASKSTASTGSAASLHFANARRFEKAKILRMKVGSMGPDAQ